VRRAIEEADADPRLDMPLEDAFDEIVRYIDTLTERGTEKASG
jgi:hypothetical protein